MAEVTQGQERALSVEELGQSLQALEHHHTTTPFGDTREAAQRVRRYIASLENRLATPLPARVEEAVRRLGGSTNAFTEPFAKELREDVEVLRDAARLAPELAADNAALARVAVHTSECRATESLECTPDCPVGRPHPGAALLEHLRAVESERDTLKMNNAGMAKEWKEKEAERARAAASVRLAFAKRDDVWLWMGDGSDKPETLGADHPVVMSASTAAELMKAPAEQEGRTAEVEERLRVTQSSLDGCTQRVAWLAGAIRKALDAYALTAPPPMLRELSEALRSKASATPAGLVAAVGRIVPFFRQAQAAGRRVAVHHEGHGVMLHADDVTAVLEAFDATTLAEARGDTLEMLADLLGSNMNADALADAVRGLQAKAEEADALKEQVATLGAQLAEERQAHQNLVARHDGALRREEAVSDHLRMMGPYVSMETLADDFARLQKERDAARQEVARQASLLAYIEECEGGPSLLTEAKALASDRQDDVRQELELARRGLRDVLEEHNAEPVGDDTDALVEGAVEVTKKGRERQTDAESARDAAQQQVETLRHLLSTSDEDKAMLRQDRQQAEARTTAARKEASACAKQFEDVTRAMDAQLSPLRARVAELERLNQEVRDGWTEAMRDRDRAHAATEQAEARATAAEAKVERALAAARNELRGLDRERDEEKRKPKPSETRLRELAFAKVCVDAVLGALMGVTRPAHAPTRAPELRAAAAPFLAFADRMEDVERLRTGKPDARVANICGDFGHTAELTVRDFRRLRDAINAVPVAVSDADLQDLVADGQKLRDAARPFVEVLRECLRALNSLGILGPKRGTRWVPLPMMPDAACIALVDAVDGLPRPLGTPERYSPTWQPPEGCPPLGTVDGDFMAVRNGLLRSEGAPDYNTAFHALLRLSLSRREQEAGGVEESSPALAACRPAGISHERTRQALTGAYLVLDEMEGEERTRWAAVLKGMEAALLEDQQATVVPFTKETFEQWREHLAEQGYSLDLYVRPSADEAASTPAAIEESRRRGARRREARQKRAPSELMVHPTSSGPSKPKLVWEGEPEEHGRRPQLFSNGRVELAWDRPLSQGKMLDQVAPLLAQLLTLSDPEGRPVENGVLWLGVDDCDDRIRVMEDGVVQWESSPGVWTVDDSASFSALELGLAKAVAASARELRVLAAQVHRLADMVPAGRNPREENGYPVSVNVRLLRLASEASAARGTLVRACREAAADMRSRVKAELLRVRAPWDAVQAVDAVPVEAKGGTRG